MGTSSNAFYVDMYAAQISFSHNAYGSFTFRGNGKGTGTGIPVYCTEMLILVRDREKSQDLLFRVVIVQFVIPHRSDSNKSSDYIAIFLSLISSFLCG